MAVFGSEVKKILDALPFYVLIINKSHEILFANKAVERELKLKPEDLIGGYCPKLVHGLDTEFEHCPLQEAVSTGSLVEKEYYDDNIQKWIKTSIYPFEHSLSGEEVAYFHIAQDITKSKQDEEQLKASIFKLNNVTHSIIEAITKTVEKRDPYTAGHQQRVSILAAGIARKMGISEEKVEGIEIAALVHDVGKIVIPIDILSKPGRINHHEFSLIQAHSETGYEILQGIEFPWPVAQIVLQHHERLDGSGYPHGIKGDDIIQEARIIAVADVVEAMSSHRPYRQALGLDKALEEISKGKGKIYDIKVVEACIELCKDGFFME
ncbi:MAG: hypothetical protein APF84_15230 [Gracilibacter sp. BRH_c7a]|nr:MAG: hypothetical protein APF84_15230 [Gracilibacter sp. BRH_c7a]